MGGFGRTDNFDGFVMRKPLFASLLLLLWNERRVEEYRYVKSCWSRASAKIPIVSEARACRASAILTRTGALVKNMTRARLDPHRGETTSNLKRYLTTRPWGPPKKLS